RHREQHARPGLFPGLRCRGADDLAEEVLACGGRLQLEKLRGTGEGGAHGWGPQHRNFLATPHHQGCPEEHPTCSTPHALDYTAVRWPGKLKSGLVSTPNSRFLLVLHQVQSPENLGAVIRALANFGFDRLVVSDPQTEDWEAVRRVAV